MNEENKIENVSDEEVKKSETVIDVDTSSIDNTNNTVEEIVEQTEDTSILKAKMEKINANQTKYLMKRIKEANIEWDKVEFAPEDTEKLFPLISYQEIEIFSAISAEFMGIETLEDYIQMAKSDIQQWIEMKQAIEDGLADEADLKYFKALSKSKDEARMILALIQQDGRKLDKEFVESNIAEETIKYASFSVLYEFIINKFKFMDLKANINADYNRVNLTKEENVKVEEMKNNRIKEINEDIKFRMHFITIMKYYIELFEIYQNNNKIQDFFKQSWYERQYDKVLNSLYGFKNALIEKDRFDIGKILTVDFKALNFLNSIIVYSMKKYSKYTIENKEDPIFENVKIKPEDLEIYEKLFNNFNETDNRIIENFSKMIANSIEKSLKCLSNIENVKKLVELTERNFTNNKEFKKYFHDDNIVEKYNKFDEFILELADLMPDKEKVSIKEWGKYFIMLKEYEMFQRISLLYKVLSDSEKTENDKRRETFKVFTELCTEFFDIMYGTILDDMYSYIRYDKLMTKYNTNLIYGVIMNSLIIEHQIGFKTPFNHETQSKGDGLYDLIEKNLSKEQYKYMVGKKEDDILLKEVDLKMIRQEYLIIASKLFTFVNNFIENPTNDELFKKYMKADDLPIKSASKKHNKSPKKKQKKNKR